MSHGMNPAIWDEFQKRTRDAATSKDPGRGKKVVEAIDSIISEVPVQTIRAAARDGQPAKEMTESFAKMVPEAMPFKRIIYKGIKVESIVDVERTKIHLFLEAEPPNTKEPFPWDPIIIDRFGQERGRNGRTVKVWSEAVKTVLPDAAVDWVPEVKSWYIGVDRALTDALLVSRMIIDRLFDAVELAAGPQTLGGTRSPR